LAVFNILLVPNVERSDEMERSGISFAHSIC
jgi:hypothetical protein